jgi:transcriptional regulator with GAF, ATPase, and Fis domain
MTHDARSLGTAMTVDPAAPLDESIAADRLRAVYRIGRALLEERDPALVVSAIQSTLVSSVSPDLACVLAVLPGGGYRALSAYQVDLSGPVEQWPLSHTVLDRVRDTGLALLAADAQADPQVGGAASVTRFQIRSIMCVPLGPQPSRGMLYVDRRGGRAAFERADLEFLSAVAGYAAPVLQRAEEQLRTEQTLRATDERLELLKSDLLRHRIIGRSASLLLAYDTVRRLAAAGARVLLRGETGTGKELFARVYALSSPRAGGPYVPIPIPALPATTIESELFGHVRGAFTEAVRDKKGRLEIAEGGVLFLDEVGDIAPEVQVKLLRFLDSGELVRVGDTIVRRVDAQIVSATNRLLERDVADGALRADLLARLGHAVVLPPLRERREDIPLLLDHYLEAYGGRARGKHFSAEAVEILQRYDWPLNVRELQQVVERAVCLSESQSIGPDELPAHFRQQPARPDTLAPAAPAPKAPPLALRAVVEDAERRHIIQTIAQAGGHRRRAAELLGISPDTLYRRLRDLGIAGSDE